MFVREALRLLQQDSSRVIGTKELFPAGSLLELADSATLVNWITSTPSPNSSRASLVEALRLDNADSIGTSTSLCAALEAIERGGRIIVVSHQPTLLSYTGVFAQFILAHFLAAELAAAEGRAAAVIYLCLDADEAFDRRVRTAHLPMPGAQGGTLSIGAGLAKAFRGRVQCMVPAQDPTMVFSWTETLSGGFGHCASLVPHRRAELLSARDLMIERLSLLFARATAGASNFADLSRTLLLDFVRQITGNPTLFLRLTSLVKSGRDTFRNLLVNFEKVRSASLEASALLEARDIRLRSQQVLSREAAWLVCGRCGRRTSLGAETALKLIDNDCVQICNSCGGDVRRDHSSGWLVPRVLLEDLLGVAFTDASLVLTYAGSAEHVALTQWTCPKVLGRESPIYTWHPRHHLGDAIENSAIDLCTGGLVQSNAVDALRLSWNGRDSLLRCLGLLNLAEYGRSWQNFLTAGSLNDPMILGEPAEIPQDLVVNLL